MDGYPLFNFDFIVIGSFEVTAPFKIALLLINYAEQKCQCAPFSSMDDAVATLAIIGTLM